MTVIDNRTANLNLALPNANNLLADDVLRLIESLQTLDTAVFARELAANKGALNGYAPLSGGLIPSQYLPGFVDDVLEFANLAAFPVTGETGKIYVALDTSFQYRWSGTVYIELGRTYGIASASVLGLIRIGSGLSIDGAGIVSVTYTIPDGSVTTVKIADNAVTTAKINNGAVTSAKLDATFLATLALRGSANTFTARNQFPSIDVDTTKSRLLKGQELRVTAMGNITGATTIDLSAGNVVTATATGNVTFSFSNVPGANQSQVQTLRLTNGGAFTLTWPANTKFAGGIPPTLTAAGIDYLGIYYDLTTTSYVVFLLGKDVKS